MYKLLASFAGLMGLFLGISNFSIVEFLVLLLDFIALSCYKITRRRNKTNQTKDNEQNEVLRKASETYPSYEWTNHTQQFHGRSQVSTMNRDINNDPIFSDTTLKRIDTPDFSITPLSRRQVTLDIRFAPVEGRRGSSDLLSYFEEALRIRQKDRRASYCVSLE